MKIIFVCTGNTCRSPLAEGYLKSKGIPDLEVYSRGLCADGSPVSENSRIAASECGIDISAHVSKQLTRDDLDADRFYCMSDTHRQMLLSVGVPHDRVFVLGNGIPDPYGGSIGYYRVCRDEIFKQIDRLSFGCVSVFKAEYTDIPDIAKLETECFSSPWSENAIKESMDAKTHFFVAVTDGNVIGYLGISAILDEGYITNIAVTEKERGRGVGTLLLKKCISLAKELSLAFISLEVRASNEKAISLYQKMGFNTEGRRKNFYTVPNEDAIIMTRRFSK